MLSGTVANWSRDFGFLRRSEGPDVFVHKRRLPPGIRLHNGDTVTFSVHQEEGGKPEAVNIVLVSKKLSRELAQPAQVARRRPGVMAELTAGEPEGLKEPPPGSDGRKLFVYFNKESVDVNSLRRLGERHGRVINCHLAGGNGKKAHAGYGYIEFASKGEAVAAQGALDGAKWDEFEVKKLQVTGRHCHHLRRLLPTSTASTSTSRPPLPPTCRSTSPTRSGSPSAPPTASGSPTSRTTTSAPPPPPSSPTTKMASRPTPAAPPPRPPPARRAPTASPRPSARPPPVVWR